MKARKLVTALPLALCCFLFLNACSEEAGTPAPPSPEMSVSDAEAKLHQAEENLRRVRAVADTPKANLDDIQKLQTQTAKLRKAANDSKKRAETMRQQTINAKKNPDDPIVSRNTYQAAQEAKAAEAKANEADKRLVEAKSGKEVAPDDLLKAQQAVDQANKGLADAKRRIQDAMESSASPSAQSSPPAQGSEMWPILTALLPFLLTTVPLLLVIVLFYRGTNKRFDELLGVLRGSTSDLKGGQTSAISKLDSIINKDRTENPEIVELKNKLEQFDGNLGEIIQQAIARQAMETANQARAHIETADREERLSFPMLVEDFLLRMQGKLLYATHDFPNDMLMEDSENGPIALALPNGAPRGMHYAVPKLSRFPTKQEYYTFYQEYFDCNPPFSGVVSIIKPAVVDSVVGGWKLYEKGQLKVG